MSSFLSDVLEGLTATPKTLPCKYLYDHRGSELFHQICQAEEYYIPATETALLRQNAAAIEAGATPPIALVEIGAGDGKKGEVLIENTNSVARYIPLEICPEELAATAERFRQRFDIEVCPIQCDFTTELPPVPPAKGQQFLGFFSGSTIGNMPTDEAEAFLRRISRFLGKGSLMVLSADLIKEEQVLRNAYNDKNGVTASFNLNLLERINRELKADFEVGNFHHEGRWNKQKSRMEMHLVSRCQQEVTIGERTVNFSKDETIHTENSRKYSTDQLKELVNANGWQLTETFTDPKKFFSLNVLKNAL